LPPFSSTFFFFERFFLPDERPVLTANAAFSLIHENRLMSNISAAISPNTTSSTWTLFTILAANGTQHPTDLGDGGRNESTSKPKKGLLET
uniref:Uncharacterized protein n=1 Tax=Romanomermis culicivorax TaxID=13658 RepID=A0A915L6J0_ROMCU